MKADVTTRMVTTDMLKNSKSGRKGWGNPFKKGSKLGPMGQMPPEANPFIQMIQKKRKRGKK